MSRDAMTLERPIAAAARAACAVAVLFAWGLLRPAPVGAAWITNGTPVCTAPGTQDDPHLISDAASGAYVAWWDAREPDTTRVFLQHVDAAGAVVGGWPANGRPAFLVHQNQFATQWDLCSDGAGGVYVVALGALGVNEGGLRLVRWLANGTLAPGWPATGVDVTGGDLEAKSDPVIAPDGAGGCIVFWARDPVPPVNTGEFNVHAQRFDAGGVAQWTADGVQMSTVHAAFQMGRTRAIFDGAGGAIVSWQETGTLALHAQRVSGAGVVAAGWPADGVTVSPFQLGEVQSMASDAAGGVFLAWGDSHAGDKDVWGARIDGGGSLAPGWTPNGTPISTLIGEFEDMPATLSDGAGGIIVVWRHQAGPNVYQTRAKRLNGAAAAVWGPEVVTQVGSVQWWTAAGTAGGDFLTLSGHGWAEKRIMAAAIDIDGRTTMPVLGHTVRDSTLGFGLGIPRMIRAGSGAAIAAWADERSGDMDVYAMRVETRSNLDATSVVSGWDGPAVPRNAPLPGLVANVTPVLDGNAPTTYLNWSVVQAGPNTMPAWTNELFLDDEDLIGTVAVQDGNAPSFAYVGLDEGPITVRGGRHSLTVRADLPDLVPESNEADNEWTGQWVWSPLPTSDAVPNLRARPPAYGMNPLPNADGFSYTRTPGFAWVTGLAPLQAGDDYDLLVYSDYTGSTSGFTFAIGSSAYSTNQTDFVVGHYSGTPTTVYPAALRFALAGGGGDFAIDQNDAEFRNGSDTGYFPFQSLPARRLVDVYEAFLTSGTAYAFSLERVSGVSSIAFEIFDGAPGGVYGRGDALFASSPATPYFETGVFVPATTGWHPVVVFRRDGSTAVTPLTYTLKWGPERAGAPQPRAPAELAFYGARPNPVSGRTAVAFDLPGAADVRLALYDAGGRRVRVIADARFDAGSHRVTWDGTDALGRKAAPGLYYARFEAMGRTLTRRMVVLR